MSASRTTETSRATALSVKWTTSTSQTNFATASAVQRRNILSQTSTRSAFLAALTTVRSAASTETIRRAAVSETRASTSLAVPGTALRVRRDASAETKSLLATIAAEGVALPTVAILGATIAKGTALAGLAILATASIGRDVTGSFIASTELRLTASLAMACLTAVALSRTAVTVGASLAGLAVLTAEAIGRDVAGLGVADTELGLTPCITVGVLATPVTSGATVSKCTALAGLAIEASATTVS